MAGWLRRKQYIPLKSVQQARNNNNNNKQHSVTSQAEFAQCRSISFHMGEPADPVG